MDRAGAVAEVDHSAGWVRRVRCEEEREQVLVEAHAEIAMGIGVGDTESSETLPSQLLDGVKAAIV